MKIVKRTLNRPIYILAAVHYHEVFLYIVLRWKKQPQKRHASKHDPRNKCGRLP